MYGKTFPDKRGRTEFGFVNDLFSDVIRISGCTASGDRTIANNE
jgi:hypothetical protein